MKATDRYFKIHKGSGFYDVGVDKEPTNEIIMVVASTGSGKSILINNIATQLKQYRKHKIIYVTEKEDSPMENAFCGIETDNKRQLKMLEEDLISGNTILKEEIEIYHPFTFRFKKKILPAVIKFFTLSIKDIDMLSFSALLSRDLESPTINLCEETRDALSSTDDIFSFLLKAFEKSTLQEESGVSLAKSKSFPYIPIESYGSKRDIEQIKFSFKPFEQDFFIQDDSCPLNLDSNKLSKIINDADKTTFFSLAKIKNEKLRYFVCIELLMRLHEAIIEHAKYPILLVYEEVKSLIPISPQEKYKKILCSQLVKVLTGIRIAGKGTTVLFTTQSYFGTNDMLRDATSDIILMRLGHEDQSSFSRNMGLTAMNYQTLTSLRKGEFVFLRDVKDKEEKSPKYRAFYVPFAHREPGLPEFMDYWLQRYPDRKQDISGIIDEMKLKFEDSKKLAIARQDEFISKLKENKKQQVIEEMNTKNNENYIESSDDDSEQNISEKPTQSKELAQLCYYRALEMPDKSWRQRAATVSEIDPKKTLSYRAVVMQKEAVKHALQINDLDFIKKYSQRKFIQRFYLDFAESIYVQNSQEPETRFI